MKTANTLALTLLFTLGAPINAMHEKNNYENPEKALSACRQKFEAIIQHAKLVDTVVDTAVEITTENLLHTILQNEESVLIGIGDSSSPKFIQMVQILDRFAQNGTGNTYAYIDINIIPNLKKTYALQDTLTTLAFRNGTIIYRSDAHNEQAE